MSALEQRIRIYNWFFTFPWRIDLSGPKMEAVQPELQ